MPDYSTAGMSRDERESLFKAAEIISQHGPLLCEALGMFVRRMEENEQLMEGLAAQGGNSMMTADGAARMAVQFAHRVADGTRLIRAINDVNKPQ
ncbi:hypothetical protein ACFQ71_02955 [Streptomyces sp. NPDC056534]|uniref:hypothetical protein n=1 Tax=Streptomyces sp. NPDC056534 TaxID=3345857 RepID=UPI0036750457